MKASRSIKRAMGKCRVPTGAGDSPTCDYSSATGNSDKRGIESGGSGRIAGCQSGTAKVLAVFSPFWGHFWQKSATWGERARTSGGVTAILTLGFGRRCGFACWPVCQPASQTCPISFHKGSRSGSFKAIVRMSFLPHNSIAFSSHCLDSFKFPNWHE